jgi:hypothetical protein
LAIDGTAGTTRAAGSYTITPTLGTLAADNYQFSFTTGTLTVSKADFSITPAGGKSKVYGETFTAFTGSVAGLQNTDAVSVTYASTGAVATANVASYDITVASFSFTAGSADNYNAPTLNTANGGLTVGQLDLIITASNRSKPYGTAVTFAGTEFSTNPATLPNADVLTVTLSSDGAGEGATVVAPGPSYPIVPSAAAGAAVGNYNISYANGTLTVTEAATATSIAAPTITYNNNGVVEVTVTSAAGTPTGDVSLTVGGGAPITQALAAGSSSFVLPSPSAGSHTLSASYAGGGNYQGSSAAPGSTLTVNQKAATVTANSRSKVYGQTVVYAGTEFTPAGVVAPDNVASVGLASAGDDATAAVGSYDIVPSGATGTGVANYAFTYTPGSLTVGAKDATLTATDLSKIYGQELTFAGTEFTTTGLVNADNVDRVALASPGAAPTAGVGSYAIDASAPSGTGLSNYTLAYSKGVLTVGPATTTSEVAARLVAIGGTRIALTATVRPQHSGTPAGNVTFKDSIAGTLGTKVLSGGKAGLEISATQLTTPGAHRITAEYDLADANFKGTPTTVATVINVAAPVTTIPGAAIPPQAVPVSNPGPQAMTLTCTVRDLRDGTVARGTSCTFGDAPTAIVPAGGSAVVSLNIKTNLQTLAGVPRLRGIYAMGLWCPGIVFVTFAAAAGSGRKKLRGNAARWLGLVLLMALLLAVVGCGGGFSNPGSLLPTAETPSGTSTTPPGSYVVMVTDQADAPVASVPFNLTF